MASMTNSKLPVILIYFVSHKPHILFLQETHLTGSRKLALHRSWVRQAFHVTYSSNARGVANLINKALPYRVERVILDPGVRYIFLLLEFHSIVWAFVNVYLHQPVDHALLFSIFEKQAPLPSTHILFSGDFNSILDSILDSSSLQQKASLDLTQCVGTFALTRTMAMEIH